MDFHCDKCQNLVSVPGDHKPIPLYCLDCDPTYSHLAKIVPGTEVAAKSKAGFQATAEVVKKSRPVSDPTEIVLGPPDLGSNPEDIMKMARAVGDTIVTRHTPNIPPKCKMKKLDGSELVQFGLNYAIVTFDTEEIIAAFGSAILAEAVCRQINRE